MSTAKTLAIISHGLEDTEHLATKVAQNLRGGETIELKSDVGGGKTTFVRGLVKALGSQDHVASPTFMISKEYMSPTFRIVHFDFYRLHSAGDIAEALREASLDNTTICLVEWGDIVEDVLPPDRLVIEIARVDSSENSREFKLQSPHSYLLEGVA